MGHSSIGYGGVIYGYSIFSGHVLNMENQKYDECMSYDYIEAITEIIEGKFWSFMHKKLKDSIPEGYAKMKFKIAYRELIANYDTNPYNYPDVLFGYDLDDFTNSPKDLSFIVDNFPSDFEEVCAEFYAKLKRNGKVSYEDGEQSDSSDNDTTSESSDIEPSEADIAETMAKLSFGLHGCVF